jgi:glycosyltransferase involved in cell wall biosynthesis
MTLAAVVITKNEERNIADCLATLAWADELIVVDAESTDRTVELARGITDRVYVRPWPGFGPQKNFGIDQAKADWILIVDADERVPAALREEIRAATAGAARDVAGFEIPRRNYFYGTWLQGGGVFPDRQLRLFRRTAGRYDDTLLHEHLNVSGRIGVLTQPFEHLSVPSVQDHLRKIARYSTLAAQERLRRGRRAGAAGLAVSHAVTVLRTYIARGGYRDGLPGLIFAMFAGMHTFLKYAKAYELQQRAAAPPPPPA